jgi:hypothetical protein
VDGQVSPAKAGGRATAGGDGRPNGAAGLLVTCGVVRGSMVCISFRSEPSDRSTCDRRGSDV